MSRQEFIEIFLFDLLVVKLLFACPWDKNVLKDAPSIRIPNKFEDAIDELHEFLCPILEIIQELPDLSVQLCDELSDVVFSGEISEYDKRLDTSPLIVVPEIVLHAIHPVKHCFDIPWVVLA
jgi:hypothetical protein